MNLSTDHFEIFSSGDKDTFYYLICEFETMRRVLWYLWVGYFEFKLKGFCRKLNATINEPKEAVHTVFVLLNKSVRMYVHSVMIFNVNVLDGYVIG